MWKGLRRFFSGCSTVSPAGKDASLPAIDQEDPDQLMAAGFAQHQQGNLVGAEVFYRKVLAVSPAHPAGHYLGILFAQRGDYRQAEPLLRQATLLDPDNPACFVNLGNALKAQGKLEEAAGAYRCSLDIKPMAETYYNLGNMLQAMGRLEEAQENYRQAIELRPDYADACNNMAYAQQALGRPEECVRYAERALAVNPGHAHAHNNLGMALRELGRTGEAIARYHQAISFQPDYAEAHNNLGIVLMEQGKLDEAIACFQKAVSLKPDYAEAHSNMGLTLKYQGRLDEAVASHRMAVSLKPDYADGHLNLGLLLLQMGDLRNGWEKYEYRWRKADPVPQRPFPQPWWQGEGIQNKTLLVWGEQGVGDELRFASLMPDLARMAGHCVFECEPRLANLFSRSFPEIEVIQKRDPPRLRTTGSDIAFQSPVASMARWLRPSLDSFPQHKGYLMADPERVAYWQQCLAAIGPGLKVGISWRSGNMTGDRAKVHTGIDEWEPIFRVHGVTFINLFYGECREELEQAERRFGIRIHRWDDLDLKNDLDEVAALTMALDLTISTGTAVCDIPGALGRPVWHLHQRYYAWDDLGQNHMPWYPSMRLFYRDWNEDWTRIIDTVAQELRLESEKI